ncbi:hypothetical protein NDU88_006643 [Pleurodeles waltl]|uniref:Uncharacterized protein n=1 Tax=Pleurodeles waltl TaxID=8319 RepID=A0AAV7VMG9_PLEWA|nr:hypothetical protein NDU88_006643 [Pleurodeles waltl]
MTQRRQQSRQQTQRRGAIGDQRCGERGVHCRERCAPSRDGGGQARQSEASSPVTAGWWLEAGKEALHREMHTTRRYAAPGGAVEEMPREEPFEESAPNDCIDLAACCAIDRGKEVVSTPMRGVLETQMLPKMRPQENQMQISTVNVEGVVGTRLGAEDFTLPDIDLNYAHGPRISSDSPPKIHLDSEDSSGQ